MACSEPDCRRAQGLGTPEASRDVEKQALGHRQQITGHVCRDATLSNPPGGPSESNWPRYSPRVTVTFAWRGSVGNPELNRLHAEAFDTQLYSEDEWNWVELLDRHSLGWVVAREGDALVGFVNVLWDGLVHAWVQDTMV